MTKPAAGDSPLLSRPIPLGDLAFPWIVSLAITLAITPQMAGQSIAGQTIASQSTDMAPSLQMLVEDLVVQFQLQYKHNPPEHRHRYDQLKRTIEAWNASPRSDADFRLMATWLQGAIRSAMPGPNGPLPAVPPFQHPLAKAPFSTDGSLGAAGLGATGPGPSREKGRQAVRYRPDENRDFWTGHPATRELPAEFWADDPFRDDAQSDQPLPPDGHGTRQRWKVARPVLKANYDRQPVQVNLNELSARIEGYDRELRDIEAQLIAPSGPRATELISIATDLEELLDHRQFLRLYLGVLADADRENLPRLRSTKMVLKLLARRVAERRDLIRRGKAEGNQAQQKQETVLLKQLAEKLSQQVAKR